MSTQIDIVNITDGLITGAGSFDILMKAASAHLQVEYDAGRILGADYASAYVSMLQATMAQAVQFELTKGQAAAQTDLTLIQVEVTRDKGGFR